MLFCASPFLLLPCPPFSTSLCSLCSVGPSRTPSWQHSFFSRHFFHWLFSLKTAVDIIAHCFAANVRTVILPQHQLFVNTDSVGWYSEQVSCHHIVNNVQPGSDGLLRPRCIYSVLVFPKKNWLNCLVLYHFVPTRLFSLKSTSSRFPTIFSWVAAKMWLFLTLFVDLE